MTASNDEDPDTGLNEREDATLARLYRQDAPRSPDSLDAMVLAQAAEALNVARRRRQRRLRTWSLAASLVLVTGLVLRLREEAPPISTEQTQKAKIATTALPATAAADQPPAAEATADQAAARSVVAPDSSARKLKPPPVAALTARATDATEAAPVEKKSAEPSTAAPAPEQATQIPSGSAPQVTAGSPVPSAADALSTRADTAAPAGIAASGTLSRNATAAPGAPTAEVQSLLSAIRALPPESRFISPDRSEELAPTAFANQVSGAADVSALLKFAARWRLRLRDGSQLAADDWLRARLRDR